MRTSSTSKTCGREAAHLMRVSAEVWCYGRGVRRPEATRRPRWSVRTGGAVPCAEQGLHRVFPGVLQSVHEPLTFGAQQQTVVLPTRDLLPGVARAQRPRPIQLHAWVTHQLVDLAYSGLELVHFAPAPERTPAGRSQPACAREREQSEPTQGPNTRDRPADA